LFGASNDNKPGSKPNKGFFFGLTFIIENRWPNKKEAKRRGKKNKNKWRSQKIRC